MFQQNDALNGGASGAARLTPNAAVARVPFGRLGTPIEAAEPQLRWFERDFTHDLGVAVGSPAWWRGVATCIGLLIFAWLLAPGVHALPVGGGPALTGDALQEERSQSIAPLAFGADSGRRMGETKLVVPLTGTPERPEISLATAIGQGDSFTHALVRAGVSDNDVTRVANMTSAVVDPADIESGTGLQLTLGRHANPKAPRPLEQLAFRARFDMKLLFVRGPGGLTMQRQPIAIDHSPVRIAGLAGGGVFMSATHAGAPASAVQDYIRAVANKVQFGALADDARYDMVIERDRAATGEVRYGKLLYVGISQGDEAYRMIQWTIAGRTEWYDYAGVGEKRSGFVVPVEGGHKTSGYGMRLHPLLGYTRMHQGTDYGAVYGSPIRAVTDGIVSFAGWHGGHGNMVKLDHQGGLGTGYGHMSRIAVKPGQRVSQGEVIGYVGSTGLSTGPHLHFEVYRGGVPVNPSAVTFATRSLLEGAQLAAFRAKLDHYMAIAGDAPSAQPTSGGGVRVAVR